MAQRGNGRFIRTVAPARWLVAVIGLGLVGWLAACAPAPQPAKPAAPAPASAAAPAKPAEVAKPAAEAAKPAVQPAKPAAQPAEPAPGQTVSVKTMLGPFGTQTYNFGFALGEMAKKVHPWLRISPGETPGFIYNVKAMGEKPDLWENTIFGVGPLDVWLAEKGDPTYGGKPIMGIKYLFNYQISLAHLVTLDSNIKTPADLKGKRIGLGLKTQIAWSYVPVQLLEHGWGITDKTAQFQHLGPNPVKDALLDGRVDAAITALYPNPYTKVYVAAPQLVELFAAPRPIYHLPWDTPPVAEWVKRTGIPLFMVTVPAGTFPSIKEDLKLWTYGGGIFAAMERFPEKYAYEFVKLALQNVDKFVEYDATGKLMSREYMTYGFTKDRLHPGALRAYEEAGIKVPEK